MNRLSNYILYFALSISYSCGIYSFSGASIPKEAKTVSIKYFFCWCCLTNKHKFNSQIEKNDKLEKENRMLLRQLTAVNNKNNNNNKDNDNDIDNNNLIICYP